MSTEEDELYQVFTPNETVEIEGFGIEVRNGGFLYVKDEHDASRAIFAPHHWHSARVLETPDPS